MHIVVISISAFVVSDNMEIANYIFDNQPIVASVDSSAIRKEAELKIKKESKICSFSFENLRHLPDSIFFTMVNECKKNKIPKSIFFRLYEQESHFIYYDNGGYCGLMSITYDNYSKKLNIDDYNEITSIKIGSYALADSYKFWSHRIKDKKEAWRWALAEYNCGRGGLQELDSSGNITYKIPENIIPIVNKELLYYKINE